MAIRRKKAFGLGPQVLVVFILALVGGAAVADPELEVIPQQQPARPGEVYQIVCEMSWVGDPAAYVILPAEVDAIDWGTVSVARAMSFVRDGANVVSQTIEITPDTAGDYDTPEIRIPYADPQAASSEEAPEPGTGSTAENTLATRRAEPFPLAVRPSRVFLWAILGLLTAVVCAALGWWVMGRLRRGRTEPVAAGVTVDFDAVGIALHAARKHRLDGKFYEFYQELSRAGAMLPPDTGGPNLAARLEARARDVGYRGVRPSDDEMDSDFRGVERIWIRSKEESVP